MELQEELKTKILKALNLEEIKPEEVDADAPLFGEDGIGLDSIDALELIVLLEKDYGIRIKDPKDSKEIFKSIHVLADYVEANRKK